MHNTVNCAAHRDVQERALALAAAVFITVVMGMNNHIQIAKVQ